MKTFRYILSFLLIATAITLFVISCLKAFVLSGTWKFIRVDDDNDEVYESVLEFDTSGNVKSTETYNQKGEVSFMYCKVGGNIIEFTDYLDGENKYFVDIKESRLILYEDEYGDEDHAKIYQRVELLPLIWVLRIACILLIAVALIILFAFKPKKAKPIMATATPKEVPTYVAPAVIVPPTAAYPAIGTASDIPSPPAPTDIQQTEDVYYQSDSVFIPPAPYVPSDDYAPGALSDDN